jgi:hypothetical protein
MEVVVCDELVEVGAVLGGKDEGFGVDAGFIGLFNLETHNPLKPKQ